MPAAESYGNLIATYMVFRDNRDPVGRGVEGIIGTPRFATGYTPLPTRPALLIETHSLKPYRPRVRGTYDVLRAALEDVNRDPAGWLRAVRETDEGIAREGSSYDPSRKVPIRLAFTDKSVPLKLKAVEFKVEQSDVSGAARGIYGDEPAELTVPFYKEARAVQAVAPPLYYVVP